MKISVCGKGGSGKSALVTLLAKQALDRNIKALVVDSDESNSGLFRMLGFEKPPVPLMELIGGKGDRSHWGCSIRSPGFRGLPGRWRLG